MDEINVNVPREALEEDAQTAMLRSHRRRRVMGIVAVFGGIAIVIGAIIGLTFALKPRTSGITVPEQFSATFQASGDSALDDVPSSYNGQIFKTSNSDGTWNVNAVLEYSSASETTVVTYVNQRAYFVVKDRSSGAITQTGCVGSEDIPPYEDLQAAFDSAVVVTDTQDVIGKVDTQCAGREQFVFKWTGQTYVFCTVASSAANEHKFVGEEFTASVVDMNTNPGASTIVQPVDASGNTWTCPIVDHSASETGSRRMRAWAGQQVDLTNEDDAWFLKSTSTAVAARRQLKKKTTCVFMHGLGVAANGGVTTTYKDYWGDVHKSAKCDTYKFLHRNTVTVAWHEPALQQYFCDQASSGGTISDTIIFTHSMGSLIVGGALSSGKCSMGSGAKWYQVEGPIMGSKAADKVADVCSNWWGPIQSLAAKMNYCTSSTPRSPTAAVKDMMTNFAGGNGQTFAKVSTAVAAHVDGAMCGRSSWGLNTLMSAPLSFLSGIVDWPETSDSMVGWSSCTAGSSSRSWSTSYKKDFYKPDVNHLDGTCRHGDGWWGNDRKPCKWFKEMT